MTSDAGGERDSEAPEVGVGDDTEVFEAVPADDAVAASDDAEGADSAEVADDAADAAEPVAADAAEPDASEPVAKRPDSVGRRREAPP